MQVPHQLPAKKIKRRRGGQRVEVEIGPILGKGKRNDVVPKLGWKQPQTSAIERFNLTDGQRNRRQPGKTLGFSKPSRFDDRRSWKSFGPTLFSWHRTYSHAKIVGFG